MSICLLWDNRDYYQQILVEVYATRAAAEEHLAAIAVAKPPCPGSEHVSLEDFTEHSIEERPVRLAFPG